MIFVDVGIPVVPSMCIVLLRCCSTAKLLWELLQGPLGFPGFVCLPIGVGSQSKMPRSWDALWQLLALVMLIHCPSSQAPVGLTGLKGASGSSTTPAIPGDLGSPSFGRRGDVSLSFHVKSSIPGLVCVLC